MRDKNKSGSFFKKNKDTPLNTMDIEQNTPSGDAQAPQTAIPLTAQEELDKAEQAHKNAEEALKKAAEAKESAAKKAEEERIAKEAEQAKKAEEERIAKEAEQAKKAEEEHIATTAEQAKTADEKGSSQEKKGEDELMDDGKTTDKADNIINKGENQNLVATNTNEEIKQLKANQNESNLQLSKIYDLLTEQKRLTKKILVSNNIRTIALVLFVAVTLIAMFVFGSQIMKSISELPVLLSESTKLVESVQEDLTITMGMLEDTMKGLNIQGINDAIKTINLIVTDISKLDFDALNVSIKSLQDSIVPFADAVKGMQNMFKIPSLF